MKSLRLAMGILLLISVIVPNIGIAAQFNGEQIFIDENSDSWIKAQAENVVVLYDKKKGFPGGAFCSGFLANYQGEIYLFTNSHCISDKKGRPCEDTAVVTHYTNAKRDEVLSSIFPGNSALSKLMKLSMNAGDMSDKRLVQKGAFDSFNCKREVFRSDYKDGSGKIDAAVFQLEHSENEVTSYKLESLVTPTQWSSKDQNAVIIGHPDAGAIKISQNCIVKSPSPFGLLSDDFSGSSDCIVAHGNSGSPVFIKNTFPPIGIVQSYNDKWQVPDTFTYLGPIAEAVRQILDGNPFAGIVSLNRRIWLSVNENVEIELRDDAPTAMQLEKFRSRIPLIMTTVRAHPSPKNLLSIFVRSKPYEGQPPDFPVIFLTDTDQEVAGKVLDLMNEK